jgi:hypothetical protein
MDKTEKDKNIVAEFMGFKLENRKYQYLHFNSSNESSWEWDEDVIVTLNGEGITDSNEEVFHSFNDIGFSESWDILMSVIQKILVLAFTDKESQKNYCEIIYCMPDIDNVYAAVVEFINCYNKKL